MITISCAYVLAALGLLGLAAYLFYRFGSNTPPPDESMPLALGDVTDSGGIAYTGTKDDGPHDHSADWWASRGAK